MKPLFVVLGGGRGPLPPLFFFSSQEVAGEHPPYLTNMYLRDAKLKFLGHAFEVINSARRFDLFHPTQEQKESIARGQQELYDVIAAIGAEGVGKYAGDKELFNLLVGDSCHAYHGLGLSPQ